ncbi:ArsA family ATPase [Haloimpatiens massiliensis]|uniref:ArsA family ATPase n=1 Tax=Haloimpatiens massiliensis TaxID=1658110 RepID=UPI000C867D98|nr:ArsA family ATPase [Haloimpatiens massiliensis]
MDKLFFFAGKGGVGKTTCSSAYALRLATQGKRTLLVSTDPAHSISDIFGKSIGKEIVNLQDNLDALEIDGDYESEKYINSIKVNLKNIVSPVILKEINSQLDAAYISPGTQESAIFDKMINIINEKSKEYDYIVFDTAPTGHTIRLLSLPELLGDWIKLLIGKREKILKLSSMAESNGKINKKSFSSDPILNVLNRRKESIDRAKDILLEGNKLNFIYVLNAERLPIEETKKAVNILKKYGITVDTLIVNRLLPTNIKEEFWLNKKNMELKYLEEIETIFSDKKIIKLSMLSKDMRCDNINEMATRIDI